MKRHIFPMLVLATMILTNACFPAEAYVPGAGIRNTPHDLSASSTYHADRIYNPEGQTDICIFCHLPHDTPLEGDTRNLPLWNHALSTVIAFEVYGSGSAQADNDGHRLSADVSLGPGPVSLFCLSCHDGSVAVNRYGALPGSVFINGRYKIGGGGALTNMHPIGFSYAEVMDNDINKDPMLGTQPLGNLLWDGRMECPTCHDVHNSRNTGEKFLWVSDRHSDLCCSCHLICTR